MSFEKLEIVKPILNALESEGYTTPTAIQKQAIPVIFEGKDLLGCAQTGTGKTAAFAIPIIQKLSSNHNDSSKKIRALILSPTRELAGQIGESFSIYGRNTKLKNAVVYGGISQLRQTNKLSKGVDILIATPGRLLDLMGQGFVNLKNIELFVLDEADRMLDMGFINDIKKIIKELPDKKQSLFFSATMSPEIIKLAETILRNPVRIEIESKTKTVDKIEQGVFYVAKANKKNLLYHILKKHSVDSAIVFTRTKSGADRVSRQLIKSGISALSIHGDKSQNARQKALDDFKGKKVNILVATDIAARGLDIEELSHVINYEMPENPENYIHRIGRTGRAGLSGTALSFCDKEELTNLKEITKLIKMSIPVIKDHPYNTEFASDEKTVVKEKKRNVKKASTEETSKSVSKKVNKVSKKKNENIKAEVKQLDIKFEETNQSVTPPVKEIPVAENTIEAPAESSPAANVPEQVRFHQSNSENKNHYHNNKKQFHKKKKFTHQNGQPHGKKYQQKDQVKQSEKMKPVIDNRSTSELKSAENLNRLASRNQAKFQRMNNSNERTFSKVWTNHEEFITIGYKKEKKYSNTGGSNKPGNNQFKKQGKKNKPHQDFAHGKKVWTNFDNPENNKYKKKSTGVYGSAEGQENANNEQNRNNDPRDYKKKKFYSSNRNKWKK